MDEKDLGNAAARSQTLKVNIFDQIYSLRSPKSEEHVRQMAQIVDERMRQIAAHTTTFELSRIAVLAALNIADELQDLKAQAQHKETEDQPTQSPDESTQAEAPPESAAEGDETGKAQTWFEAIFDAEVPVKERSERLSSQISTKLKTTRQETSKDADAADKEDKQPEI